MTQELYPCTIIMDRYGGAYSGGAWLAFALECCFIPQEIDDDDITCMDFWLDNNNKNLIVGRGNSPQSAYENLLERFVENV